MSSTCNAVTSLYLEAWNHTSHSEGSICLVCCVCLEYLHERLTWLTWSKKSALLEVVMVYRGYSVTDRKAGILKMHELSKQ